MKRRAGAGFTLNLSDGPHKRSNATLRRRRGTGFADICIDFGHGWVGVSVSGGRDELDHVSGRCNINAVWVYMTLVIYLRDYLRLRDLRDLDLEWRLTDFERLVRLIDFLDFLRVVRPRPPPLNPDETPNL